MKLQRLLVILILLLPFTLAAQHTYFIKGTVIDSSTGKGLGFVTIIFNAPANTGTVSNAFGNFEFKSAVPVTKITCSFIGYNAKTISVNPNDDNSHLEIRMLSSQYSLHKVTILPGENPANRIVRAVIAHREENDPDKVGSYSYTAYNKFIYSGVPPNKFKKDDSSMVGLFKFLEDHYFFILENVVETEFEKPDVKKEKVIGSKMSGVQDPSFTLLNTQIQPIGFYKNFIEVVQNQFINPFCNGSTERYFFNIEDTLYSGKDTIYKLSFRPHRGKKFDGLRGIAEINSDGYAIQHITAEPADTITTLMKIKIEQYNERINGGRWFPVKFVTDIGYNNMLNNGLQVMMLGTTTLSDIKLDPVLKKRDFTGVQVEMLPDAGYKKADFWNKYRPDTLTTREQSTYQFLDSIGKKKHFDAKLKFLEGFLDGELRFRYLNFDMARFLWLNSLETARLGVGFRTNESVFRTVSIGGFAGYSIAQQPTNLYGNQRWKYGGNIKWKVYAHNDMYLNFSYSNDLEESGAVRFYKELDEFTTDLLRSYLINTFDLAKREQIDFTGRTLKYMHFDVSAFTVRKFSTSDYRFITMENGESIQNSEFPYTGIKAAFRYGYKEKMVQAFHNTFFLDTYYPVFYGQVTQGFNNLLGGQYTFTKVEGKISYELSTKALGDFYLQVAGGYVMGKLPLGDLFAGRGSYELVGLYSDNTFQTMRLNEFYSNKYAAFYFEEDLRTLLLRGKKFQPRPMLIFNAAIGTLSDASDHYNYAFKTLDKGYYETGLLINDIISKQYLGVVRLGLGVGGFYRLGYYTLPTTWDNLALKINFDVRY